MTLRVLRGGESYRLEGEVSRLKAANEFLEALCVRGLSPATIRAYAFDLLTLDRWLEESGREITELDQAALIEFIAYQRRADAQPSSINRRLTTCTLLYRFVTGGDPPRGVRATLPAPYYKGRGRDHNLGLHSLHRRWGNRMRVKNPHKVVQPLTSSQVKTFLLSLRRYRDLAITYLMMFCGLRSQEVLSLRIPDLEEGRLRVHGKGNRERMLPLLGVLGSVLSDYLRLERPSNARTDHIFLVHQGARRGAPMTPSGLRRLFRYRRETRKDIQNANAHRFRHTFGADMACAGVDLAVLQRLMGHADGKTTLQYINLSMADVAKEYSRAIEAIEKRYEHEP